VKEGKKGEKEAVVEARGWGVGGVSPIKVSVLVTCDDGDGGAAAQTHTHTGELASGQSSDDSTGIRKRRGIERKEGVLVCKEMRKQTNKQKAAALHTYMNTRIRISDCTGVERRWRRRESGFLR
jgi:GTPase